MATYEQLQMNLPVPQESPSKKLPSYRPAFPVNRTALRERVWAMVTSAIYGERLQELSENLTRFGSSVKIRRVCSPDLVKDTSLAFLPTLFRWGIAFHGGFGALATSMPLTSETVCSLWLTPQASDGMRSNMSLTTLRTGKPNGNLAQQLAHMFPTPCASGWGNEGSREMLKKHNISETEYKKMTQGHGGALNPTWVEWLMGFPTGWTGLDASETP
ncbi:MAG: hypothetical protein FWD58_09685 [Firmicutes bacterium]|nr:hypothetical protein [Bacillota bacterium]